MVGIFLKISVIAGILFIFVLAFSPPSLAIDDNGLTKSLAWRRTRIAWPDLAEVTLRTEYVQMRGSPPKPVTKLTVLDSRRVNQINSFNVPPEALADYLIKRQHQACPAAPAYLNDQRCESPTNAPRPDPTRPERWLNGSGSK